MCEFCIVKPDLICYNGFVKKIQPVMHILHIRNGGTV